MRALIIPLFVAAIAWAQDPRAGQTKVNTKVFINARRNTGLFITERKFCNPTKENSRLPAEELVRLRNRASRNGNATSRKM